MGPAGGGEERRGYTLGHSEQEIQRLDSMGRYLSNLTRDLLLRAGLRPGMRVVDYGTGIGSVALLAAEIVGPTGEVVAIDRPAEPLALAERRAATARQLEYVHFMQGDESVLDAISRDRMFDAVIGRLVLVHQTDPVVALRTLMRHVRPGGIVAFHEIDADYSCWSEPHLPLLTRTMHDITDTFRRAGIVTNAAKWARIFDEAGVQDRRIVREGTVEDGREPLAHVFLSAMMRSILPLAEKLGVTTAAEADLDTLNDRLTAEAAAAGAHWIPAYFVAAWGRVPN